MLGFEAQPDLAGGLYTFSPLAFLVVIEQRSLGVLTPRPPIGWGSVPPPNPPSKHRWFETVSLAYSRFVGL